MAVRVGRPSRRRVTRRLLCDVATRQECFRKRGRGSGHDPGRALLCQWGRPANCGTEARPSVTQSRQASRRARTAAAIAGRADVARRQATVTRRVGSGRTATTATPAGSSGRASRGTMATPSPAATSVICVSNSPTTKSGSTPGQHPQQPLVADRARRCSDPPLLRAFSSAATERAPASGWDIGTRRSATSSPSSTRSRPAGRSQRHLGPVVEHGEVDPTAVPARRGRRAGSHSTSPVSAAGGRAASRLQRVRQQGAAGGRERRDDSRPDDRVAVRGQGRSASSTAASTRPACSARIRPASVSRAGGRPSRPGGRRLPLEFGQLLRDRRRRAEQRFARRPAPCHRWRWRAGPGAGRAQSCSELQRPCRTIRWCLMNWRGRGSSA